RRVPPLQRAIRVARQVGDLGDLRPRPFVRGGGVGGERYAAVVDDQQQLGERAQDPLRETESRRNLDACELQEHGDVVALRELEVAVVRARLDRVEVSPGDRLVLLEAGYVGRQLRR